VALTALGALAAGALLAIGVAVAWIERGRLAAELDAWIRASSALQAGFTAGRVLLSYWWAQVAGLALLLLASGLALAVSRWRRSSLSSGLLVLLVVVDLFRFGIGFNPLADPGLLDLEPPVVQFLRAQPGHFRIVSVGRDDVLPPNLAAGFGLHDVRGYDSILLRDYVDYMSLIEPQILVPYNRIAKLFHVESLSSPYLDVLNVRYVLTTELIDRPGYRLVFEEGARVYENDRAMPRAYVVYGAISVPGRAEALQALREPGFDPWRSVVLEGQRALLDGPTTSGGTVDSQPADLLEYAAGLVVVRARATQPGYLVLADTFYPGWVVRVDHVERPLLRANRALRAVALETGEHEVRFTYEPASVRIGLTLSAAGLAGVVGLGGLGLVGRRAAGHPARTIR
jgi:hypothetical protein